MEDGKCRVETVKWLVKKNFAIFVKTNSRNFRDGINVLLNMAGNQPKKKTPVQKQDLKQKKRAPKESPLSFLVPLLIILPVVFIAFSPILKNELTNWDDPDLIINNPLIRSLSYTNLKTIFTTFYFGNYQPLHLLSYALEYHFWQLNPAGYHAVSLVLFLMITTLVYWFIFILSKKNKSIAILATLLFAVNAMRVESVAWAAERKDMLYALFYVAGLIAYVKYIINWDNPKAGLRIRYFLYAFLLFILSVFSKVMAVSFVGAMVMLDYFYARKISFRMIIEKIPFILVSFAVGIAQVKATVETNTIDTSNRFTMIDRLLIVCRNFMFYFYKMIAPFNLSTFHPYPTKAHGAPWPPEFYFASIFVLLLAGLLVWSFRKTRIIVFAVGFMLMALALVLQYIAIGPAMFNERYSLIPAVAFSFALASGIVYLAGKFPKEKYLTWGATGAYLLLMFYLTFARCGVWKTSLTLWDDVLSQYPRVGTALNNRGKYYGKDLGDINRAKEDLSAAIRFEPDYPNSYSNRGIVYCMQGKFDSAIGDFNTAIRLPGNHYDAFLNRAIAYAQTNHPDLAMKDFNVVIRMAPGKPEGIMNRGILYLRANEPQKALDDFNTVISMDHENPEYYQHRARALVNLGKYPDAWNDLQTCINAGGKPDPAFTEQVRKAAGR